MNENEYFVLKKVEQVSVYSWISQILHITLCVYYHDVIEQQVNISDKQLQHSLIQNAN